VARGRCCHGWLACGLRRGLVLVQPLQRHRKATLQTSEQQGNSRNSCEGGVLEEGKRGHAKAWPKRVPTQALGARFCSSARKIEVLWCMLGHVCHSGTPRNIYAWPLCLRYQWPRGAGVLCPTLLSHRLVRVCTYCLGALLANRTAKVVAVGFMAIFEGGIRLRA